MEATRDADVVINPSFVADNPNIIEILKSIGLESAIKDRPGIYGLETEFNLPLEARTTFDILVPEMYAGKGRRAARIPGQKNAAGRAMGLELSLWDRHLLKLETVDEPKKEVEAYVAGPAALLVAKAHKVHERLEQVSSRPERLRPKDSGDIALLTMVSDPSEVAQTIKNEVRSHPEITTVVQLAFKWLIEMYGDSPTAPITRKQAADSLATRFNEKEVFEAMDAWLNRFIRS
jgi:hypothetical protein